MSCEQLVKRDEVNVLHFLFLSVSVHNYDSLVENLNSHIDIHSYAVSHSNPNY